MRTYLLQRALAGLVTLIGVTILIFLAMRVLPGDPLAMMTSESGTTYTLSDEELQAARAALGLDRPYYQQYLSWMADVMRGDLGHSFWREEPINELIKRRGPITAEIASVRRHPVLGDRRPDRHPQRRSRVTRSRTTSRACW